MHNSSRSMRASRGVPAACIALVTMALPASADVIVISSSAAAVKPGKVYTSGQSIEIPSGAKVRIMLPSGRTQELKGPLTVKAGDLGKGEATNESLWNDVKRLVATQKTASESTVGAVRSTAPKTSASETRGAAPKPATPPPFSWRRVPIDKGGDVCVEKGVGLELLRTAPGRPLSLTVVNIQSKARAPAEFAVGSATSAWPASVGTDVGLYALVMPDGEKRDIRLRPIAPLPAADETLRVLHSQRCLVQVEAWLRGQMTASR